MIRRLLSALLLLAPLAFVAPQVTFDIEPQGVEITVGIASADAATVTPEATTADTFATPNSSDSFTPVVGDLLVVGVCVTNTEDTTATLSSSISGFTFSQIADLTYSGGTLHHMFLYVSDAHVASATPQTVTVTMPTDSGSGTIISVAAIAGISLDGVDAVVQTAQELATGSQKFDPIFGSAVQTGNPTLGFLCMDSGPQAVTPTTNWTEGGEADFVTPLQSGEWQYRNSGFTGTEIEWPNDVVSGTNAAMTIEIDSSAGAEPAFDSGPNATFLDTDTYRISYNASGVGDNVYAVVKFRGSASCSCDAIEANTCAGEINYATEATTGSDDTLDINVTLPASDPLPLNDLDICIESGGVDSTVIPQNDEFLQEPTGVQWHQVAGSPDVGQAGLFDNASPAIVDDDTMEVVEACDSFALGTEIHGITVNSDTTFNVEAGGDQSRHLCGRRFADYSIPAWSDAALVEKAINDLPALFIEPTQYFLVARDDAFVLELDPLWQDPEGDDLIHEVDNIPASGSTDGENLEGPLDVYGEYTAPIFRAIDEYGEESEQNVTIEVGLILPDFTAWMLTHPFGMDRAYGP